MHTSKILREKYYFYEQEFCNHICERGILQERQIWLGRLNIPLW